MHRWDPERYLTYADERGRPFVDLLSRVDATDPRLVVDLGCGPGTLTTLLTERWQAATVVGLDSSPEMIDKARAVSAAIDWRVADLRDWVAGDDGDGGGDDVDVLVSNATLQWVPGHLDLLPGEVDAWETTYLHVLTGEDPVFTWVSGTGARPTLQALPDGPREEFEAEFRARLRAAYPPGPTGVVLPFRRIFVVARVPAVQP